MQNKGKHWAVLNDTTLNHIRVNVRKQFELSVTGLKTMDKGKAVCWLAIMSACHTCECEVSNSPSTYLSNMDFVKNLKKEVQAWLLALLLMVIISSSACFRSPNVFVFTDIWNMRLIRSFNRSLPHMASCPTHLLLTLWKTWISTGFWFMQISRRRPFQEWMKEGGSVC